MAVQTTGFAPLHTPAWHVSVRVQPFPSLQLVPFATAVCVQVPLPLQESAVQAIPSSQEAPEQHSPPAPRMLVS